MIFWQEFMRGTVVGLMSAGAFVAAWGLGFLLGWW